MEHYKPDEQCPTREEDLLKARGYPENGTVDDLKELQNNVERVLRSRAWNSGAQTAQGMLTRTRLIRECGAPPMRVLHSDVIEQVGRIPKSDEGYTVDASEALRVCGRTHSLPKAVCVLLSHRWLRPSENFPDTADNQKARTASELAKWIKWFLTRPEVNSFSHHPSESCVEVFFWVDWACMDQTPGATAPYIYSLPLYTGACWLFANVESADYDKRAWCLVERAMAYAFMRAGVRALSKSHHLPALSSRYDLARVVGLRVTLLQVTPLAVPLGFTHRRQAFSKVPLPLLRPESANLTFESDRPAICLLSAAAQRSNSFAWWRFARYYCCDVLGTQWSSRLKLWLCSCGVFCCGICCLLPWYYSRRLSFDGDDASMITVHRLTDEPPVQTNPPTAVTTMRKQQ